jgi:hypothetical protein
MHSFHVRRHKRKFSLGSRYFYTRRVSCKLQRVQASNEEWQCDNECLLLKYIGDGAEKWLHLFNDDINLKVYVASNQRMTVHD